MFGLVQSNPPRNVECCLSKAKNWEAIRPILDRERNRVHHLNVNSTEKRRVEKARGPRSVNF
jgi:hypothetical protein